MGFDFDQSESEWTTRERGSGIDFAVRIFLGRTAIPYARVEAGEVRRIISARRASRTERREWQQSE